ncbi:uncharacterized protein LOC132061950 [Lycium ferocissimum]|uniref:uncharacterized protein LOC132061950 n=1 Tax=Lycium ferocissimum TaxID=112874 RepID=UPI002814B6B1|nr:uncharacterized protein LOC132061950 [Lycium ferocissimum]
MEDSSSASSKSSEKSPVNAKNKMLSEEKENTSPNAKLHDIVSHKVSKKEIQKASEEFPAQGEEKDTEHNINIIHKMTRATDLSPKKLGKSGKKAKSQENCRHIQKYKRRLGMKEAFANCNGKIWVFIDAAVQWEIIMNTDQQITLKLNHPDFDTDIITTFFYAKCDAGERLKLWDNLYHLASSIDQLWLVGGDFNVILSEEEKLGGLPVTLNECEDFAFCINSCDLFDMGFKGSPYTWWNGRTTGDCIFKRLDRVVVNQQFQNMFANIEVEHLSRIESDHTPLMFKLKLKKLKGVLSFWSRETFGDIFQQLAIREEVVKVKEALFEEDPSIVNRIVLQKAQAEMKQYLNIEEQYWKQKAGFSWYTEGDRNTAFFHNYVNGKRRNLMIKGISDDSGNWLDNMEQISKEAVRFFQNQFTQEAGHSDFDLLKHIHSMFSHYQNMELCAYASKEEVKQAVFALSGDSASGPDGFTGLFYQQCWEIIGDDVLLSFFDGTELPKSVTHTNLVLIPKKHHVQSFSDLRPISLSNFINKVISRVIHGRMEKVIPSLISSNQSGFVKGRTEVLSRALNSLFEDPGYVGYGMPKWSRPLNHLAYADDSIILLQPIQNLLRKSRQNYEVTSGQLINKDMSSYYMKRKEYYSGLIKKVKGRLHSWKGKILSFGGKAVLIRSVLQTMPVHLLSVLAPPKCVLNELYKIFARYFWSNKAEGRSRHWIAWKDVCLPIQEGGLGFKSLFDVSNALFAKLWWRFRTSNSLWANYMWNKYCKKEMPILVQWK